MHDAARVRLVHQFLDANTQRDPEHELIVQQGARESYGAITQRANRVAQALVDHGLRRGDRVALAAQNSSAYVEAYFGILKAGAIAVPVNTSAEAALLAHVVRDCSATALISDARMERLVNAAAPQLDGLRLLISPAAGSLPLESSVARLDTEHLTRFSVEAPRLDLSESEPASIIYTSGSTGRPRGATLTHRNLVSNIAATLDYLRLTPDDRVLAVLPFFYVYGKSVLNTHVAAGATVVIENRFQYLNAALDTLEAERCTGFSGVPSTFALLLNRSNFETRRFAHLRYVTQAGGGMSPALTRRLLELLPDKKVFVMYGATEAAARLAYVPPEELPTAIGSIGRAITGVELVVLRPDGSEAAADEVGELIARGPNIMQGYWNAPEETALVLDQRGFHTGDLARKDAKGLIYLAGRIKDIIKSGGHRIGAKEIEEAVLEHAGVHEAAVIGVPDELLEESIKVCVVPREAGMLHVAQLLAFLSERLPPYKLPHQVELLSELPKNESGKVMKAPLRAVAKPLAPSAPRPPRPSG
jgi:long-chain acyl-CoA synthetase